MRISLDDFGTGYSSLSYLHSLPLNKVKIDRSFLQGLETGDRSLILLRGVARLSAELGLSVTVEGIETEEQLALVAARDQRRRGAGLPDRLPHARQRHPRHAVRAADPHQQGRLTLIRSGVRKTSRRHSWRPKPCPLLAVWPASCARARPEPELSQPTSLHLA